MRRAFTTGLAIAGGLVLIAQGAAARPADRRLATYANPIDLPYRYQPIVKPHREAADPTVIWFKDRYWLFASHSHGYWHSTDLLHWSFVEPTGLDVRPYAPTVEVVNGKLYLAASEHTRQIWTTDDPLSGKWTVAAEMSAGYQDPDLFRDDDGRLYLYEGSSGKDILHAHELDPRTFRLIRSAPIPESRSKETRGWEVNGEHNDRPAMDSYIEGSWMTKHGGRYYLQYAAPATEVSTYADGVLVADRPMGPFRYQEYSPFSSKPTGFIGGAGHGSTFRAPNGPWWHIATMSVSKRFMFERRLGLFPAGFNRRGELVADTYLGDYPHYVDGRRELTGWMLLSRKKAVTASSELPGFPATNAVDEDVRTWWSAASGAAGEWFQVDLGAARRIDAVQINFADQDSKGVGISGDVYDYVLEVSTDGAAWRMVVDRSTTGRDAPHDYQVLPAPIRARFVRLRNVHAPDGGKFSLYDLRVFGSAEGTLPGLVHGASFTRDPLDPRHATVSWSAAGGAEFYVARLGIRSDLLTQNYQVYDGQMTVSVRSLNVGSAYCFAVDAVNETGVRAGRAQCVANGRSGSKPG